MSIRASRAQRTVLAAIAGLIVAATFSAPDALAKQSCDDRPYNNEAQASGPGGDPNAAGVRFNPNGDVFEIWDNLDDEHLVFVDFNYAGVADRWKNVGFAWNEKSTITRNVDERYKQICFRIKWAGPDSPIVRYTTRP